MKLKKTAITLVSSLLIMTSASAFDVSDSKIYIKGVNVSDNTSIANCEFDDVNVKCDVEMFDRYSFRTYKGVDGFLIDGDLYFASSSFN